MVGILDYQSGKLEPVRTVAISSKMLHHSNHAPDIPTVAKSTCLCHMGSVGNNEDNVQRNSNDCVIDLGQNSFNRWNHTFHECLWCPCILYACFICMIPAVLYMQKSDELYCDSLLLKAKLYAGISTLLFGIGLLVGVFFYFSVGCFVYYINFVKPI